MDKVLIAEIGVEGAGIWIYGRQSEGVWTFWNEGTSMDLDESDDEIWRSWSSEPVNSLDLLLRRNGPCSIRRRSTPTSWDGSEKLTRRHDCRCPWISADTGMNISTSDGRSCSVCRGNPGEIGITRNRRIWNQIIKVVIVASARFGLGSRVFSGTISSCQTSHKSCTKYRRFSTTIQGLEVAATPGPKQTMSGENCRMTG
jgi:hypothetical protein